MSGDSIGLRLLPSPTYFDRNFFVSCKIVTTIYQPTTTVVHWFAVTLEFCNACGSTTTAITQQQQTQQQQLHNNTNTNTDNSNHTPTTPTTTQYMRGTNRIDVEALLNVIGTRRQFPDGGPVQRMAAFVLAHLKKRPTKEAGWGEGMGCVQ